MGDRVNDGPPIKFRIVTEEESTETTMVRYCRALPYAVIAATGIGQATLPCNNTSASAMT